MVGRGTARGRAAELQQLLLGVIWEQPRQHASVGGLIQVRSEGILDERGNFTLLCRGKLIDPLERML